MPAPEPVDKPSGLLPARTFVIAGSVAHPALPFVQALEKEKFRVVSGPGLNPIGLRYGTFWKDVVADSEFFFYFLLPKRIQRWELTIDVLIDVKLDPYGNHAVTVTGYSSPRRGYDFLFETVDQAARLYAASGQLLHRSDFFTGDAGAMKAARKANKLARRNRQ